MKPELMDMDKIKELNETKIIAEFVIQMYSNGTVNIHGPIGNFFLFRSAMNGAEKAVLDYVSKQAVSQPSIIVPDMKIPKGMIGRN